MGSNREIDVRVAKDVFGYDVWEKDGVFYEAAPLGERVLRNYSKEMGWAQEVLEKMKMTVIPIQGEEWFVFVGPEDRSGWESPTAVLNFLEAGNFAGCGAASGRDLPALICDAALKAVEKRASEKQELAIEEEPVANNVTTLKPLH